MGPAVDLLARQLAEAHGMVRERLAGLTEDEYYWEPVPEVWTLRRLTVGRLEADYADPDPDPPPFTTLGWRVNHIASCKVMYHEYAYGPQRLTFPDLPVPATPAEGVAMLDEGHDLLVQDLQQLEDHDLQAEVLTNWGERWPAWRIFWTMIHHDLWHGGEIGALRDLYRESRSQQAAPWPLGPAGNRSVGSS
jgi:hypothetical protein